VILLKLRCPAIFAAALALFLQADGGSGQGVSQPIQVCLAKMTSSRKWGQFFELGDSLGEFSTRIARSVTTEWARGKFEVSREVSTTAPVPQSIFNSEER
jgi:hypothetical protein